jgi:hypothetical protein
VRALSNIPAVALITADLPARYHQGDRMKSIGPASFCGLAAVSGESRIEQERNPLGELCWEQFAIARRIEPFRLNDIVA